ncbi:MAG: class I SAM-dependent methyltransferase [Bacteroidota bacterium]
MRFKGELIVREEACKICHEKTGRQIGVVDYWDIKTCIIVVCEKCNHIQLDPMLTEEETAKGCSAYYHEESKRTSKNEQIKNCERNFRRGVVFGYKLKIRKLSPRYVLELGPGSGYFAAGLQFVFPGVEITVMDINREVLNFNQEHHNFKIIREIPDNFAEKYKNKFDIIIARDIIEHVTDISKVLENVNEYLRPNGLFHFITPNGGEDIWKHYLTSRLDGGPSELLINHVNYFNGKGLKNLLIQKGFRTVDYYTYGVKTTFRGYGWKENRKLMSPVSKKTKADHNIEEGQNEFKQIDFRKTEILNKWYIQSNAKWLTYFYSLYHHYSILRISPERNIGHEIYGLFKKQFNPDQTG